jgi:hypothetical protein
MDILGVTGCGIVLWTRNLGVYPLPAFNPFLSTAAAAFWAVRAA